MASAGGNVQVLTDHTGFPLWVSAGRPGSTVDLTAARELVLPTLYPYAVRGLPVVCMTSETPGRIVDNSTLCRQTRCTCSSVNTQTMTTSAS